MAGRELETLSLNVSLSDKGLSIAVQSRFISALDRMFGGMFAIPAAFLEGRAAEIEIRHRLSREAQDAKSKLKLDGELRIEQLTIAAEYLRRQKETKELLNLGRVTQMALEDLREASSPDHQEETESTIDEQISDDWLNWFQSFAEKASSDEVRRLWSKILSGEVMQPGRFSIATLRTLSEVDRNTALLFQQHVDGLIGDRFVPKPDELKGDFLIELTSLEDAGLIREVNGSITLSYQLDMAGKYHLHDGGMILEFSGYPEAKFLLPVFLLSRAGQELFTVIPKPSAEASFRKVAKIAPQEITEIKLGVSVADLGNGQVRWTVIEALRGPDSTHDAS